MSSEEPLPSQPPRAEPLFNSPWAVLVLLGALIGAHALRVALGIDADAFAMTRASLSASGWPALFTYQFTHAGWLHLGMNSVFILAFGAPVARYLGQGPRGALAFLAFFLACGAVAALGYAALHPHSDWGLVGASGAASGLMGAAARLIEGQGRPGRLLGRTVVGMTVSWIIINVALGATGLTPGAMGVPVAWEAHIIGYLAGLFLVDLAGWAAGARPDHALEH